MPSDVLMNCHMAKLGMAPQHVSWLEGTLTIHEVSKFFSIPIVEVATKLSEQLDLIRLITDVFVGVFFNASARKMALHGGRIARYSIVTVGKSVEEIIEEGLKELATNLGAYKIAKKQPTLTPENTLGLALATPPISATLIGPNAVVNI